MRPEQHARKAWADRFNPMINLIVRQHLGDMVEIIEANEIDDRKHAIDATVEAAHNRVAKRVRCCDERDITIRTRPSEEHKLEAGYVSHYFYGWAENRSDVNFAAWMLFRVRPFIDSGLLRAAREIPNRDGLDAFKPVPATDLFTVPQCIIESYGLAVPQDGPHLFWPGSSAS